MLQEMWDGPPQTGFYLSPVPERVDDDVEVLRAEARGENLPPGRVPQRTWWAVDEMNRFAGIIRLRHPLTETLLRDGGNIGYIVRPSMRGQGIATEMLALVLDEARQSGLKNVLLTTDTTNEESRNVIERNGGVLDPVKVDPAQDWLRYWIPLKPE